MNQTVFLPLLAACVLSIAAGRLFIPFLRKLRVGQTVRDDGPQTHLKKNGTPTMGGIIFIFSITVVSLFYASSSRYILPILFMMYGFGIIGFIDDYIKVVLKRSMGLRAWQKMAGQIAVTAAFAFYMVYYSGISLAMYLPFAGGVSIDLGFWNIPFMFLVILGTVNGANFTDGLDGQASMVTIAVAGFLTYSAIRLQPGIAPVTAAVAGALFGFLFYNAHPASVFMGDTGSLALGGFVAAAAYILQEPVFIILVGFIYLLEVVSVILQVGYFKMTHGKRIFKMAPIHHHFEKSGYAETKVAASFALVTVILCTIACMGVK